MPRNNGQKSTGNSSGSKYQGNSNRATFIDLSLSASEDADLKKSQFGRTPWVMHIAALVETGMKITIKRDMRTASVMAMCQDEDYDPDVPPVIYVMRGGSASTALLKLAYYLQLADGQLPDEEAAKGAQDDAEDYFA